MALRDVKHLKKQDFATRRFVAGRHGEVVPILMICPSCKSTVLPMDIDDHILFHKMLMEAIANAHA